MIRRCVGSSAARRPWVQRRRRAKWVASRRSCSLRKRTFRRLPVSRANGSIAFMRAVRREASCSTWIRASGDLERCALRPGNVHSADGWDGALKPVVERYQGKVSRIYLRADAGFANPEVYEFLEAERIKYAIRLPANRIMQERIGHLLTRPIGRPPNEVRRSYANFTYQAGSWTKSRRVCAKVEWHPGELYPRGGFIITNMSRPAERVVAFYNKRGTCEQWIKEGNQMDAAVMSD